MSTTQPIRKTDIIAQLKNYYYSQQPNLRNYALISFGLNTALRISDILSLRWRDVYEFEAHSFRSHLMLYEGKTGKSSCILLNPSLEHALLLFMQSISPTPEQYIFIGSSATRKPLSRCQAYRIVKNAAVQIEIEDTIGCHSLRKTFGYHAWKKGIPPALLMSIYNHSSYLVTKRYLGIDQDDRDEVFMNVQF